MMKNPWILKVCALSLISCLTVFNNAAAARAGSFRLLMDLWPAVPGTALWLLNEGRLKDPSRAVRGSAFILAVMTMLWMFLWMLVWLASLGRLGEGSIPLIRHLGWVNLAGFGLTMAVFFAAFREKDLPRRTAWFWVATGWCTAYVSWVSLVLEPSRHFFTGPALGGILLMLAALFIRRMLPKSAPATPRSL